jgi:cytochrome c-type biogenesis protein CcmH
VKAIVLALALLSAAPAVAVQPDEMLADPKLEARAREISKELRCMVCQNQSIDDSDAGLARDLRVLVRERLTVGDSDSQVIDYLVKRYGEFVLLKPRFEWQTVLLWITPGVVLAIGAWALFAASRRRREAEPATVGPALTAAEQRKLAELTKSGGEAG